MKNVLKEIIIILLLCLIIIFTLGILLYEYVPMSKIIPDPVAYTTSEEIKKELASSSEVDENKVILTYEVNSEDLSNYKKTQEYKPGKSNPFEEISTQAGENIENNNSSNNTSNNQGNSNSNNTTNNGNYYPDKGIK